MNRIARRDVRPLTFFDRTPGVLLLLWIVGALMGAVIIMIALVAGGTATPLPMGLHAGLTALASALLIQLAFSSVDQLRAQHCVWLGRVAPRAAWHRALQDHPRMLLISWALAALPLFALRLLAPPVDEPWASRLLSALWPVALLAGLMGLALVMAAASNRLLSWRWGLAAAGATVALLLGVGGLPPLVQPVLSGQALLLNAGLMVLLAGGAGLALPWVHRSLTKASFLCAKQPGAVQQLRQAWTNLTERWRLVDSRANAGLLVALGPQLPNNLSNPNADAHFFQAWGSTVSPLHGLRLLILTIVATTLLRGALLHWRVLLAPGGGSRRCMGSRVVGATLVSLLLYVAFYIALTISLWALLPFFPAVPWQHLPALAFSHVLPLLADLTLAVALAAWLRGLLGSQKRVIGCLLLAGLLVAGSVLLLTLFSGRNGGAHAILWTRGPAHIAAEFGLAAVFTVLAQRAWARADLGELTRKQSTQMRDLPSA